MFHTELQVKWLDVIRKKQPWEIFFSYGNFYIETLSNDYLLVIGMGFYRKINLKNIHEHFC